ncbi:hypothetical protein BDM02DRAFT_3194264 [Thelephora ganbajun]|uniref:Uncharacterized protein n=1 Tax=Thelephora ganbajun TaxID=370292 RepID=A0ACB6YWU3_THEGA|nr:hypothetical protein BDM02DRAFT_3194264 [Thelephora ganbajun]
MSYDVIVKNIAENIATISSGFKNLSTQDDYPNVKHWFKDDYKDLHKTGKSGAENLEGQKPTKGPILSSYMEDEDGNEIPEWKRKAARSAARGFFNLLFEKSQAPATWGEVSIDISNELMHILETEFPFLHLCKSHWKAKRIATNSYSQWYRKALKRRAAALAKKAAGAEVIDVDDDSNNQDGSSKRPQAEDGDTRHSKRPHVEETQPAPPRPRPMKVTTQHQRNLFTNIWPTPAVAMIPPTQVDLVTPREKTLPITGASSTSDLVPAVPLFLLLSLHLFLLLLLLLLFKTTLKTFLLLRTLPCLFLLPL